MSNENKYQVKESYKQPFPDINHAFWHENITGVLINQYKDLMKGNIADFGCNNGINVGKISILSSVDKIVGFDINEEAIEEAKNIILPQVKENSNKISFVKTNLTNINWEKEYFDFAYSFHTLEHIFPEDVDSVIEQITSLLKKEALLLINLPDKHSYAWEKTHVFHPDLSELNQLFTNKGYAVVESYHDQRGGQTGHSQNITALYKKIF